MGRHANGKARNLRLTLGYLIDREAALRAGGYRTSKWILFSRHFLDLGYRVFLYEAINTRSKYVTLERGNRKGRRQYKVRFSDHKPALSQQDMGDSDFYVGVSNGQTTTTHDAIAAAKAFFDGQGEPRPSTAHQQDARHA